GQVEHLEVEPLATDLRVPADLVDDLCGGAGVGRGPGVVPTGYAPAGGGPAPSGPISFAGWNTSPRGAGSW
ncbi:hypothetical protein ACSNOB_30675, partial [Micromonospora sp. URMC 106]|uniref:hypothetical protein n=1 Tax=Micromonospora sp. URMC 106 TaxID=3423408 RepID=UPI003F1AEF33